MFRGARLSLEEKILRRLFSEAVREMLKNIEIAVLSVDLSS